MFRLIGKLIKISIFGVVMLFIAIFIVQKVGYEGGGTNITETTNAQQEAKQDNKTQSTDTENAKQKELNEDTQKVLKKQEEKQNEKHYTKSSDVWTDDKGNNVVQPNIDKQEQKMKNHDKDAPFENPTASGKSFLGDDIK